jgi:type II secretory pathway pseudopilin PulG
MQGFSLVEVLVAIGILTLAFAALILIFPGGFETLQISANSTNADRLAEAELERLTGKGVSQLQGIYAVYHNTFTQGFDSQDITDASVTGNDLTGNAWDGSPNSNLSQTDNINSERHISGELARIPPINSTNQCLYQLDFGPIYMPNSFQGFTLATYTAGGTANTEQAGDDLTFAVRGTAWDRVIGNSAPDQGTLSVGGAVPPPTDEPDAILRPGEPEYLIDYNRGEMALPNMPLNLTTSQWYTQVFSITYQCTSTTSAGTGAAATVTTQSVDVPNWVWNPGSATYVNPPAVGGHSQWFPVPGLPTGYQVVPGSEIVTREFHNMTGVNGGFDQDPYEYTLPPTSGPLQIGQTASIGIVYFNPIAASLRTRSGGVLTASIDYNVFDWHVMHEDRTMGPSPIHLSLANINQMGTVLSDNSIYPGVVPQPNTSVDPGDIYIEDVDKGQLVPLNLTGTPADTIDYTNGVITLADSTGAPHAGTADGDHLRIFYKASGDWGLSAIKAPSVYVYYPNTDTAHIAPGPQVDGSASYEPACGTYTVANITDSSGNAVLRFFFPLTDSGKDVTISGLASQYALTPNQIVSLDEQTITALDPSTGNYLPFGIVDIPVKTALASTTAAPVAAVRGATMKVRVLWKEHAQWKHRDLQTIQIAPPTQQIPLSPAQLPPT